MLNKQNRCPRYSWRYSPSPAPCVMSVWNWSAPNISLPDSILLSVFFRLAGELSVIPVVIRHFINWQCKAHYINTAYLLLQTMDIFDGHMTHNDRIWRKNVVVEKRTSLFAGVWCNIIPPVPLHFPVVTTNGSYCIDSTAERSCKNVIAKFNVMGKFL